MTVIRSQSFQASLQFTETADMVTITKNNYLQVSECVIFESSLFSP
jgi:hypothetical protein